IYIGLHIATHAKRILELRAAYRLVLVHITCMFAYVHTHARGTTVIRQRNTHILSGALLTAQPRAHKLTHTLPLLHTHILLQLISLLHLARLHIVCYFLIIV